MLFIPSHWADKDHIQPWFFDRIPIALEMTA